MGQMAPFSMLEQITNMAAPNAAIADNLTLSQAVGLIGRTVTYIDAGRQSHTGNVESVTTSRTASRPSPSPAPTASIPRPSRRSPEATSKE